MQLKHETITKNTKTIVFNLCKGGIYDETYFKKEFNLKLGDQPYLKIGGYILWNKLFPKYNENNILDAYKILLRNN